MNTVFSVSVTAANGTKIAHFDFVVEDYRGFNISKGLRDNPTMGAVTGTLDNKSIFFIYLFIYRYIITK